MMPRQDAVFDKRYAVAAQTGIDLATAATWDRHLSRRTRILVPMDVQAFVVSPSNPEPTVPVSGGFGDPAPFAAGVARATGVHLHWAMPDALLAGKHDKETSDLELPRLPDRWVVVRTMQPAGARQVQVHGWVIDASLGSVMPMESYSGTPAAAPSGTPTLNPLNGAAGGSLMWTASYTASAGRFGFHDPLSGVTGNSAVYTVAGWWSDLAADPLAGAFGPMILDRRLGELGWFVVHDADDYVVAEEDPRIEQHRAEVGLSSPSDSAKAVVVNAENADMAGVSMMMRAPVAAAYETLIAPALPRYATLVHGSVLGVPISGALPPGDDRPAASALGIALGQDIDDVVSAFGARALALPTAHRRNAETLVAAFTSGLIEELGAPDGLEDLAEREHGDGFWSLQGTPLPAARPDVLRAEDSAPMGPMTVGRKGRAAHAPDVPETKLEWGGEVTLKGSKSRARPKASMRVSEQGTSAVGRALARSRQVLRPAPRFFRPQPPMVALRGARPNHRHHGDGLFDESGRLRCRYPRECVREITGVVNGTSVVPGLGSGGVPAEVLSVVREAVLINPYGYEWLAEAGSPTPAKTGPYKARLAAEMTRLYGAEARYDGGSPFAKVRSTWDEVSSEHAAVDKSIAASLAEHSLMCGTTPSPIGITTWRQPWVPLWLEWRVSVAGHDSAAGWELDGIDLDPSATAAANPGNPVTANYTGRSVIGQGASKALQQSIQRWMEAEIQRDATGASTLPTSDQNALARMGDLIAPLDMVSASLDGIREQLLGIPYVGVIASDGDDDKPVATGLPVPLFAGTLTVQALRLVDAFGRVLDVPASALAATATTLDLEVAGSAPSMLMRPRIQHLARWLFRLVDPAQPAITAPGELSEAFVDQLDPAGAVNPIAGFLLPDHIDEELEAFTVDGTAIGAIGHDSISGAVTWEPAPGRPLPPDAGPLAELDAHSRITGEIAAGLVLADAAARDSATPPEASALSAMLRAIDTTLWTVDTFNAVGSPTVAGLVGRPVAIVRASLRLDAPDDVDEVDVTEPGGPAARRQAYTAFAEQRFTIKLGAVTRTDDALLGFYVDDDYTRLHLVDRVIAAHAIEGGRHRGHLGLLGTVTTPAFDPLAHPYLVPDGSLSVRIGQTVRLTLLMLPIGRVHLTSGILPRKQLALSDEWVTPGLRRLVPSVRVGPVLVDPAEIRLPLVNLLGDRQTFTRRTGPLTWKHDPIVAATQTAYLPRLPHEAQEGWVRVTPVEPEEGATA